MCRETWAWNSETASGRTVVWWFSHTWNTSRILWNGEHDLKPKLSDDFTHNLLISRRETASRSDDELQNYSDAALSSLCCNVLQIIVCVCFWPNLILNTQLNLSYNTMDSIHFKIITTLIQFTWMEDETTMTLKPSCDHQTCPLS